MSAREDIRTHGTLGYGFYLADRALARLTDGQLRMRGFWFYSQRVAEIPIVESGSAGSIEIRKLNLGEISEESFGRPVGAITQRFHDGSVCFGALKGGELVGFMWLHFGPLRERLVRCTFEPQPSDLTGWDYDFFVAPRYRLGRTFARLWDSANAYLRERGIQATGSWVEFANRPSARAHERLGAIRVGWAAVLTIFRAQFVIASVSPYLHFGFSDDSICHLRIRLPVGAIDQEQSK